jgi:16S rRNA (guanine(966)-N(2))-methyltransferase RsmD
MRIIAGSKRGMKLASPTSMGSRPVTDRVKESLFDVLYNYGLPEGAVVADVFSGVGSMGLEALSREAEWATFVEMDRMTVSVLEKNIEKAGFAGRSRVVRANAFKVGAPPAAGQGKYGLVFVDPPYARSRDAGAESPLGAMMRLIGEQVSEGGYVVLRTEKEVKLEDGYGRLVAVERRQWGTMSVVIFERKADA